MKILATAKPEHFFYCVDGSVIRGINELEKKLRTISNEAYSHHANESKNDFHNWIRDVFQEQELANDILTAKTQAEAAAIVRKHLSKAVQAPTEIENAINSVLHARMRVKAAGTATKTAAKAIIQRKRHPKRKAKAARKAKTKAKSRAAKNIAKIKKPKVKKALKSHSVPVAKKKRKINKMTLVRRSSIKKQIKKRVPARSNKRGKRGISFFARGFKGSAKKSRNSQKHKSTKKQVNRWLNWLRIVPVQ